MHSARIILAVALCVVVADAKPSWIHHYPLLHHHVVQPVLIQPVAVQPVAVTHTVSQVTHVADPWAHIGRVATTISEIGSNLIRSVLPSVLTHIRESKKPIIHSTTHIVQVPQTVLVPAPHPVYVSHPVQPVIIQSPPPVIINQPTAYPSYELPKPKPNLEDDVSGSSLSTIGNSKPELDLTLGGDAGGNLEVGLPNDLSLNQGSSVSLLSEYGPPNV